MRALIPTWLIVLVIVVVVFFLFNALGLLHVHASVAF